MIAECPRLAISAGDYSAADFEDARLLVVEQGTVGLVSEAGTCRRMLIAIATRGDVLSTPSNGQRLLALEDAVVVSVTEAALGRLLGRQTVAEAIVGALLERLHEREESLAQFGNVAHVERVRRQLLQLSRRYGKRVDGGVRVELPLTHALIAQMVGSARETVSGAIGDLEREGFLRREDGRYLLRV